MPYQIFSANEWIYPDTAITCAQHTSAPYQLHCAIGGGDCCQLLTDIILEKDTAIAYEFTGEIPFTFTLYQMLCATVDENSAASVLTTKDYDSVAHFVTRRAPFQVYEITKPLDCSVLTAGRGAFFIRADIPQGFEPGTYSNALTITVGGVMLSLDISVKVYNAEILPPGAGNFHMINWLNLEHVAKLHQCPKNSAEYWELVQKYLDNQLDMRNDYLMLPTGNAIRGADGHVTGFDFSEAEKLGKMALRSGFQYILGGFVARFIQWDAREHFLLWDRSVSVVSFEAYRQLKLYFTGVRDMIVRNNWQEYYMQCLVDEPQFQNSEHYRILSCICRKFLPGIPINDPVESCDLEGALEVWVVKQAIYEKYIEKFQKLQELGEEMWIYTCGFPGGYTMNRVIDLPLLVSRLPMWMCYRYNAKGFLHWGYNVHNDEVEKRTCFVAEENAHYPAGNSFVVYPGDMRPWYSVRGHLQRLGAQDYELLYLLGQKDRSAANSLIEKVCSTFDDYNPSAQNFDSVRAELLSML